MDNMEYEQIFLKLLGLKCVESENPDIFKIITRYGKQIGEIKRKKLHGRKIKKGAFGYQMKIDSDSLFCFSTRVLADDFKKQKFEDKENFFYKFDIKKDNEFVHHVELDLGENPSLSIWSDEYGFINFTLDENKMYFEFRSKTDSFNVEEYIEVLMDKNEPLLTKQYIYKLSYCSKDNDIACEDTKTSYLLDVKSLNEEEININECTLKKGKLIKNDSTMVNGNVLDTIIRHKDGIDAFNRFRYFVNDILPFKQEIIGVMLDKRKVIEYPFTLFIPDYSISKTKVKK